MSLAIVRGERDHADSFEPGEQCAGGAAVPAAGALVSRIAHFIWLVVASASTLAGNATPLSSVANLIVLQQAGKKVKISFWQFARVGLIVTLLTTLLGHCDSGAGASVVPGS